MPRFEHLTVLTLIAFSLASHAAELKWEPITTKAKPVCSAEYTCRIVQSNASFEIQFAPTLNDKMQSLKSLEIKNLSDGSVQKFSLEEMNNLPMDEYFEVYKLKTKPDTAKDNDLAIYAYSSAREGKVFYYLVYDAAAKKFVMSERTFPKLNYDAKTKQYSSELQGSKFILGSNLKFTEAPKASK